MIGSLARSEEAVTGSQDLREWIQAIEARGELVRIAGADPKTEIGAIVSALARERNRPAVLFERIKGDASSARILGNPMGSMWQLAYTLGLEAGPSVQPLDVVDAWRQRVGHLRWT